MISRSRAAEEVLIELR
jgi:hypothetical protein